MRHVTEERLRHQLRTLAVKLPHMLPFYEKVLVKVKRWHQAGAIQSPYKEALLLGPSPLISHGWVVRDNDHLAQHARAALLPDPLGDAARIELSLVPDRTRRALYMTARAWPQSGGSTPLPLIFFQMTLITRRSLRYSVPRGGFSSFFFVNFFVNHVAEAV